MKPTIRFMVIGGAGSMGRIVVRDLYETAGAHASICVADYNRQAAIQYARSFRSKRVLGMALDITNKQSAVALVHGSTVIINCTSHHLNVAVMEIALAAGVHYVDLGGLFFVTKKQLKLHTAFKKKGLLALIGMGASPGITNIMALYAARQFDAVQEIHCRIGSRDTTAYSFLPALPVAYSIKTLLEEFSFRPPVFTKGKLEYVEPMSGAVPHNFGKPIGIQKPMYTIHSELATLPNSFKRQGVQEVSFKIAFDDLLLDRIRFLRDVGLAATEPITVSGQQVVPIDVTNQVVMSQKKPVSSGPLQQYEIVRTIVKGTVNGKKRTKIIDCHTPGMPDWDVGVDINTGAPPAIAAQMIARGDISLRGVLPAEKVIEPEPFFEALTLRNMHITTKSRDDWSFAI